MAYSSDIPITVTLQEKDSNGNNKTTTYIISSQHRRTGNPNKTIWSINFDDEVLCFTDSINSKWLVETSAWGLISKNNSLEILGHNNDDEELSLAKFVDGNANDVWHGYPADYFRRAQDRPPTEVLKNWVIKGFITKSKMSKIRRGQLCNL